MAKNIPFFDMFAELQVSGDLRLKLAGAELTGASIDQSCMSISLYLVVENPLAARDVAALRQKYGYFRDHARTGTCAQTCGDICLRRGREKG